MSDLRCSEEKVVVIVNKSTYCNSDFLDSSMKSTNTGDSSDWVCENHFLLNTLNATEPIDLELLDEP